MAGIDERDAKLILRADDRATKTFQQVGKSVEDLTARLRDQAKAAASGEGSLDALTETLREFESIGKDLVSQQSAIKAFNTLASAGDKVAERVDRANKALEDYVLKQAAAGKDPSQSRYDQLSASIDRAAKAQTDYTAKLDVARERLAGLGLTAENAAAEFNAINGVAERVVVSIGEVSKASETLVAAQARVAAEAKETAAAQATAAQAAREAAAQDDRESATAVKAADQRRKALLAASSEILEGNRPLSASFAELNAEIARTDATDALRRTGAEAVAAATNLNRFAQTGEVTIAGVTRLADAVRSIVTPTLSTVQTLDGALKQVEESANVAASTQKKRVAEYQDSLNALTQAQATLVRQASNIDAYTKQLAVVDRLDAELGKAAIAYRALGQAAAVAEGPNDQLVKDLAAAEKTLNAAGAAAQAARTKFVELQDGLKRAGVDTNNLTDEIARLESGAARSAPVAATLTKNVGGDGKGFLGLKSYELQNLSYQVNDVFTSLASGISPTQTLAQQGGQIAQVFPGFVSNLIKFLPLIAAAGAGIALVAYNLAETKKQSDAVRGFATEFAGFGDSAGYSAQQFGQAQVALERIGVSADDAKKALREFVDSGLDPRGLNQFLETARSIAAVTGEDLPMAVKQYSDALTGGYASVAALNDVTHTLTDSQLAQVKTLFDAGEATKARTLVEETYRAKLQGVAEASQGPWTRGVRRLSDAFRSLADEAGGANTSADNLSNGVDRLLNPIIALINRLKEAAGLLQTLRTNLASVSNYSIPALVQGRFGQAAPKPLASAADSVQSVIADFAKNAPRANASAVNPNPRRTKAGQEFIDQQREQLRQAKELTAQERLQEAEAEAGRKAAEAGLGAQDIAQAKLNARKIEQSKIDKENETASNKAAAAAAKAEREREAAARKAQERLNQIAELSKQVEAIDVSFAAKQAKQDDPFATIRAAATKAVADIQDKFRKLKLLGVTTVDGKTEQDFKDQIAAGEAIQIQQATLKKNEEDLNALLDQRKQKLAAIEDQLNAGTINPAQALAQQKAVFDDLNPQVEKIAHDGKAFAESIRTAKFNPQLEAQITKFDTASSKATSGADFLTAAQGDVNKAKATLDALVAQRNSTIQLQEALEKVGLVSAPQAQRNIAKAFTDSRPAIEAAADDVVKFIDSLLAVPGIPPTTIASLESLKAQVLDARAGTQALTGDQLVLRNAAYQALSKGVSDFITSIGDAVAGAIDGSKNLGEVLSDIGNAALSFAANFTKAIAQAIIQLLALKAAKAILNAVGVSTIGLHTGGVVGQNATFRRNVPMSSFLGAARYHTGGLAGIRPDEVPAILQRGEEVLTADDPRHRANGGLAPAAAAPVVNLKNVNLFDPGEAVSQGANTAPGERAILNVLSRNPSFVRSLASGG